MSSMMLPAFESEMPSERLLAAVSVGDVEGALAALKAGASPNFNRSGTPVLLLAVASGSVEIVEAILARGADPNASNRHDWMPAHEAARLGHAQILRLFAKNPMVILDFPSHGEVPLHHAASGGHAEAIEVLLGAGCSVDTASHADGSTALMKAVDGHHKEAIAVLLSAGANPDMKDASGRSARDRASDWSEGKQLFMGVAQGSDVHAHRRQFEPAEDLSASIQPAQEEAPQAHAALGIGVVRKRTPR